MALLNRVPAQFLHIVQTTLDSIVTPSSAQKGCNFAFSNSRVAHRLAIDIFADWIVPVMLLDGVWWIACGVFRLDSRLALSPNVFGGVLVA
jgi:hypothetical protein